MKTAFLEYGGLSYVSFSEVLARLGLAAVLSFLLGLDREIRQKSFGLRTHMLLCIGTCGFVLILMEMVYSFARDLDTLAIDPARIIQAVVVGIGFLAAGTIIRAEQHIVGATTSAGIWALGSIGLACGLGLHLHAIAITGLILLIVICLRPLDTLLTRKDREKGR